LRSASPEKLAERVIGEWIGPQSVPHRLRRRHCDDTRHNFFHQQRERCNDSIARLLGLLRNHGRQTRVYAQHREAEQHPRSQNSPLHMALPATENRTHNLHWLFF